MPTVRDFENAMEGGGGAAPAVPAGVRVRRVN